MAILHILFGFGGRISRQTYWSVGLASGILISIAICAIQLAATGSLTAEPPPGLAQKALLALNIFGIWTMLALAAKRLQDLDRSAWWLVLPIAALSIAGFLAAKGNPNQASTPMLLAIVVSGGLGLGLCLWLIVYSGFRRGTVGPNRFGPDPLAPHP